MTKAIIFDCGGVLVARYNSPKLVNFDLSKMLKEVGGTRFEKLAFRAGISEVEMWKRIARHKGFAEPYLSQLKYDLYDKRPLDKKVYKLAEKLSKKYKTAIVSDGIHSMFWYWDKKYKFKKIFPVIILSYDVKTTKPYKKIYQIALRQLRVRASEVLFIDDRPENIAGAKKVGIRAYKYTGKNFKSLENWIEKELSR